MENAKNLQTRDIPFYRLGSELFPGPEASREMFEVKI